MNQPEQYPAPSSPAPQEPVAASVRPPFNELSVLFPILTLYTAGYMALLAAEFFLGDGLRLPPGLMGKATRSEVMAALGVSATTAKRILADMTDQGLIRIQGVGRGTSYALATGSGVDTK